MGEKIEEVSKLMKEIKRLGYLIAPLPYQVGDHPSEVISPCSCCGLIAKCDQFGPGDSAEENYATAYIVAVCNGAPKLIAEIERLSHVVSRFEDKNKPNEDWMNTLGLHWSNEMQRWTLVAHVKNDGKDEAEITELHIQEINGHWFWTLHKNQDQACGLEFTTRGELFSLLNTLRIAKATGATP